MRLILLATILLPILSFSQIKVEEVEEGQQIGIVRSLGQFMAELNYYQSTDDYTLVFRNWKYTHINVSEAFSFRESDYDAMYKAFAAQVADKKKKDTKITLDTGNTLYLVSTSFGMYWSLYKNGIYFAKSAYFNKTQIDKLFGY